MARDARTPERRRQKREWQRGYRERGLHTKANRDYRHRHPERLRARSAVAHALERGDLVRQPCESCGDPNAHAHHDDYGRPLDVRWLCPTHHAEHHAGDGA
jgi:hypothetical protein